MKDRAYLVITHGEFGIELVKSVEMIMGPQDHVKGLGLRPGESVEDLKQQALDTVHENTTNGKETVILCDILGGSPSNVGLFLLSQEGVEYVVTGVSMPLLISLLSCFDETETKELLEEARTNASENIRLIDMDFIKGKK